MTISPSSTKSSLDPLPLSRQTSALKSEIVEIWSQVQVRIVQLAGGDPSKVDGNLTIEGVLQYLDKAESLNLKNGKEKQKEGSAGESIRTVFERTLQFIDTVGGIVAGGASEVIGPSELCFNAISMVINAWQSYQGIFESLAALFSKCSDYLSRLEYYIRGGMDIKLAKVAVQHLQLFVEICDRAIKLRRSKRRKLIVFTKLLFLNDNDIADLLGKMESLVDKEGRLVTAQTFSFAAEAAVSTRENLAISRAVNSKIDMLIASRSDSLKESDKRRRKEKILEVLAFDDNKMDPKEKKEPEPYWQRIYYNYRKCVVPDTGQWIFEEPEFRAWEKGSQDAPPILAIEGAEGSGKSYIASTIIRRLRNRTSTESSDARTLLAFYFVEGDSKEELKRTNHLDVIAKSLVWQFAQADASYMKSIANICERNRDMDPHEIPSRLLFENKDIGQTIDANFFIVIDGLNDVVGDNLVTFLQKAMESAAQHRKIRILLTGRPRAFEKIAATKNIAFRAIHISERNRADIDMYIESRMDTIEALRNKERFGVLDLRKKIRVALRDKTAGDYFRVNTILKRISNLDYVNDIDHVLENAGKERSQQIEAEIETLNDVRNSKEIAEINEITLWILFGREWFKPRQMAAVLYVQSGELSLLTFEAKLQLKYTLFEVDSDGDVDFRSYEMVDLIPEGGDSDEKHRHSSKRVLPEEVNIVRHFLQSVCPPTLYQKFDFETVFEHKLHHTGGYIHRDDEDTAEAKLAVTCLRILTEPRDARREIIRPYAATYYYQHLSAIDLSLVERKYKRVIGPLLVKLFLDEPSTDALLWTTDPEIASSFSGMAKSAWLEGSGALDEVLRWLKESVALTDVEDDEARAWAVGLTKSSTPEKELLQRLAKRMVVHWLREETPQAMAVYAFSFILGALKKINRGADSQERDSTEGPTVEDISEIEEWSRTLLDSEKDSLWEVQVAVILRNFKFDLQAERRCRSALKLDPTNWRASYNLAHVIASNEEAIGILNNLIERLGGDDKWMQKENHVWAFAEMLFDRGQRLWDAEAYDQAIESFTKSVQINYTGFKRILTIIEQYYDRHLWSEILSLLKTIQTGSDDKAHLSAMLVDLASEETFHNIVLQTAVETGQFEFIEGVYKDAIKLSTAREAYTSLYYIRYHYANEIFQQDNGEERALELWEVALKDDLPRSFLDIDYVLPDLVVKLAPIYLSRARDAPKGSETARYYLDRIASMTPDEVSGSNVILPAKLYLARYYQVEGDNAKAKQIVRSVVKLALEMLSDDDSDNDYLAYWRLLLVFLPLNDDKNALAAVTMAALASRSAFASVNPGVPLIEQPRKPSAKEHSPSGKELTKKERKEQSPRPAASNSLQAGTASSTPETRRPSTPSSLPRTPELKPTELHIDTEAGIQDEEDLANTPVFAICDGGCGHFWEDASEMWWCRDCINLTFDKDCFEQLQSNTLPLKVCDKEHEFLKVPAWDDAVLRGKPRDSVPYAGKAISLEEWKKEIVREYID